RNATISGRKFDDLNANGVDNSDPGVGGFTINAYADNGDGSLSAAEFAAGTAASTSTAANGSYTLSGLKPGSYIVCEIQQSSWIQSKPSNSKCAATLSGADGGYAETLISNQAATGDDFGNYRNATISGRKFDDLNANGVDNSDPGVGGFTINAYADNGDGSLSAAEFAAGTAASTSTAANGSYTLSGLKPGSYIVCEIQQSSWIQSKPSNS